MFKKSLFVKISLLDVIFPLQHDLSIFAKCCRRPGEDKLLFIQMLQSTSDILSNRMCLNLAKHYMVNFHLPSLGRLKDHTLSTELPWALLAQVSSSHICTNKCLSPPKAILQALGGCHIQGLLLLKQLFLAYQGKKMVRNVQKGTHVTIWALMNSKCVK